MRQFCVVQDYKVFGTIALHPVSMGIMMVNMFQSFPDASRRLGLSSVVSLKKGSKFTCVSG